MTEENVQHSGDGISATKDGTTEVTSTNISEQNDAHGPELNKEEQDSSASQQDTPFNKPEKSSSQEQTTPPTAIGPEETISIEDISENYCDWIAEYTVEHAQLIDEFGNLCNVPQPFCSETLQA